MADENASQYKVGDMVLLTNDREGEIKYFGQVEGLTENTNYYGIELTDGQSAGDNSGSLTDKKYFECEENRGLFLESDSTEIRRLLREKDFDNPRRRRNLSMKSLNDIAKDSNDNSLSIEESVLQSPKGKPSINYNNLMTSDEKVNSDIDNNRPQSPLPSSTKATTESGRQFQEDFAMQMNELKAEEIISICPFILVGRGVAGIDEMRECMDDSKIYFGLLQIQIGGGHFARCKNIFIHFNGERHPKPLQRAKINRKLPTAKEVIGHCHAPLVVTSKDLFQVDWVFNSVKGIFVADNIDTGKGAPKRVDLSTLKNDYKSQMEKASLEAEKARIRLEQERARMEDEMRLQAQREDESRLTRIAKEEEDKRRALEEAERLRQEIEIAEKRRIRDEKLAKKRKEDAKLAAQNENDTKTNNNGDNSNGGNTGDASTNNGSTGGGGGSPKKKKKKKRRRKRKKKDNWSDERPWTAERVLAAVHADMSPYNWAIFAPNNGKKPLKCLHWGHGSIANLREYLAEDRVQYGLMRLTFGSGKFKRSHFVYFLYTPDAMTNKVTSNARSKNNKSRMLHVSWQPHMQKLLQPFNVSVVAESLEKVTVNEWINRVKKNVVIDGNGDDLNEEALQKALAEEQVWLAKLRKKQEEDEHKRREFEAQEKEASSQRQREKLRLEKEKGVENASEITAATLKLKTSNSNKKSKSKNNLDVLSDDGQNDTDDGKYTDSEYYDVTASEMDDDSDNNNNNVDDDIIDAPIVVQLSQEELDRLADERRLAEIEERRKQAERAKILEEAMHSRLCLESVELVKRESEQMCWVLIEPRMEPPKIRK